MVLVLQLGALARGVPIFLELFCRAQTDEVFPSVKKGQVGGVGMRSLEVKFLDRA